MTAQGIPVAPGFAPGSYAAFKAMADQAMVMGDLVLREEEVAPVMARLLQAGLSVAAVHNRLNEMSPQVMYMHYGGHGDPAKLAVGLRNLLSASGPPLRATTTPSPATGSPSFDPHGDRGHPGALRRSPECARVPGRGLASRDNHRGKCRAASGHGVGMPVNFQDLGHGKAASLVTSCSWRAR